MLLHSKVFILVNDASLSYVNFVTSKVIVDMLKSGFENKGVKILQAALVVMEAKKNDEKYGSYAWEPNLDFQNGLLVWKIETDSQNKYEKYLYYIPYSGAVFVIYDSYHLLTRRSFLRVSTYFADYKLYEDDFEKFSLRRFISLGFVMFNFFETKVKLRNLEIKQIGIGLKAGKKKERVSIKTKFFAKK